MSGSDEGCADPDKGRQLRDDTEDMKTQHTTSFDSP
jgi:hypothetical protein